MAEVLKELALLFCLNVDLRLLWVPTNFNIADAPSRVLFCCDALLSNALFLSLGECYGPFVRFDGPLIKCLSHTGVTLPSFSLSHRRFLGEAVFSQRVPYGVCIPLP